MSGVVEGRGEERRETDTAGLSPGSREIDLAFLSPAGEPKSKDEERSAVQSGATGAKDTRGICVPPRRGPLLDLQVIMCLTTGGFQADLTEPQGVENSALLTFTFFCLCIG